MQMIFVHAPKTKEFAHAQKTKEFYACTKNKGILFMHIEQKFWVYSYTQSSTMVQAAALLKKVRAEKTK